MISTLFSPRVSQALEYDSVCKKCFEEFDSTHQALLKKMDLATKNCLESKKPLSQDLVQQVSILSLRVKRLAEGVKSYIHEKGVLSPRRSISPRAQSQLTNIEMLRRVKLAQSLQLEIDRAIDQLFPHNQMASQAEPPLLLKGRMTMQEYQFFKNFEFALLVLTVKVADYIHRFFPKLSPTIEDIVEENERLLSEREGGDGGTPKKPRDEDAKSPGAQSLKFRLDPALQNEVNPSFPSTAASSKPAPSIAGQGICPPALKSQAQTLQLRCEELHGKLIAALEVIKREKSDRAPLILSSEPKWRKSVFDQLLFFVEKVKSRSCNIWSTLNRVRPYTDELLQLSIQGMKQCECLQLKFLASLEKVEKKSGPREEVNSCEKEQLMQLADAFAEEYQMLNEETLPLLVNMSAEIREAFAGQIETILEKLMPQAEGNPGIAKLLSETGELLFQAQADLEEVLEEGRNCSIYAGREEIIAQSMHMIGAYQIHEIKQEMAIKNLRGACIL